MTQRTTHPKQTIARARGIAFNCRHFQVGLDDLLVALMGDADPQLSRILDMAGLSEDRVDRALLLITNFTTDVHPPLPELMSFTPGADEALHRAADLAGDNAAQPRHLLQAVLEYYLKHTTKHMSVFTLQAIFDHFGVSPQRLLATLLGRTAAAA